MGIKLCPKCTQKTHEHKHGEKIKKKRSKSYGRSKGLAFERDVANLFKKLRVGIRKLFPDARRHLEFQMAEAYGVDLVGTHPYLVQCKAFKEYAPITAIQEVRVDPIEGGIPVLITKGDRQRPVAVVYLEDFLALVRDANH